jgi:hypothetical protein
MSFEQIKRGIAWLYKNHQSEQSPEDRLNSPWQKRKRGKTELDYGRMSRQLSRQSFGIQSKPWNN